LIATTFLPLDSLVCVIAYSLHVACLLSRVHLFPISLLFNAILKTIRDQNVFKKSNRFLKWELLSSNTSICRHTHLTISLVSSHYFFLLLSFCFEQNHWNCSHSLWLEGKKYNINANCTSMLPYSDFVKTSLEDISN
jgi:hypothetical protein